MPAQTTYIQEKLESGFWVSRHTIRSNMESLLQFSTFLENQETPLSDTQIKDIVAWRNSLMTKTEKSQVTNRTINVRMRAVVRFLEWAILNGHIRDSFYGLRVEKLIRSGRLNFNQKQRSERVRHIRLVLPEHIARDPLPTMDEIQQLAKQLPQEFLPMMSLMLGTGMRLSEILSVPSSALPSYRDTLSRPKAMHVIKLDTRQMTIKNRKPRSVYVSGSLFALIYERQIKMTRNVQCTQFFTNKNQRPWHPSSVQKAFAKASQKAGLRHKVTPHTLRHVFATRTLENWQELGFSTEMACLIWLQQQLGHSQVTTTVNTYINMTSELHAHDRSVLHQYEQELLSMMEGDVGE
ncbi:tyrosine-type recombinase/integrase [Vibrio splendidus]|nr:site-specific integrase [Vibrio splendidus]